jgi:hypothetical protein
VPLFFIVADKSWDVWASTANKEPRHICSLQPSEVENYFRHKRDEFAPGTIFRAKTWFRAGVGRQLDFVDTGLLPMLEHEAGGRLLDLFERMVSVTMNGLNWSSVPDSNDEAHWLTKTSFWLLAAKLLHDKRVSHFINLDLQDIPTVFNRVAVHYNRNAPSPPRVNGRLRALQAAASVVSAGPSFCNISAETLGMLYEEALISPTTRKLLGTHRTPTYLVDYMVARLSDWIGELGYKHCHVFEPACGHAPFLSGTLRLLSDMLPARIADDQKQRHDFIRDHLRGCDHDAFALEIARLSLTLADIPNENGWVLESGDMFAGSTLANEVRNATVVLANPPFEKEQAAKFFQRTVQALQPGTVFGFVLPVNELTGSACDAVRRQLLRECEIKEISVFSDGMFRFASVETGIVLGRKHETKRAIAPRHIRFRRVRETRREDFREHYFASWDSSVETDWLVKANGARFIVPELRDVWDACQSLPKFKQFADIGQGLIHRSKEDPRFPKGAVTESDVKLPGLVEGFSSVDDSPNTHLLPVIRWLNLDKETIRRPVAGTVTGVPQVLLNYAPVDRDAWRLKAFIDAVGRPATSRFLLVRPRQWEFSLDCLWALCNSPVANAYTFALGSKRDIPAGLMRMMPVPDLSQCNLSPLESAVRAYREAAAEFTRKFQQPAQKSRRKSAKVTKLDRHRELELFPGEPTEEVISAVKEQLRVLHWRVDAEVLRLYNLPSKLERELLDTFDGVLRVGMPFEQTRYIPCEFRDVLTLDEFLRITDEWDATEARRCHLIEKRIKTGRRSSDEEAEFRQLQRLLTLHRRFYSPLPTAEIKVLTKRIKEGNEWENDD